MNIRQATKQDTSKVLYLIKQLAIYEKMEDEVIATEELLNEWMFEKQVASALLLEDGNQAVGFALYFFNFSTFVGRAGLYLEDLYILPEYRKKGYGKALFQALIKIANENHCGRMEWVCLDWNQPSIDFYLSLGAKPMHGWTTYRLTKEDLKRLDTSK